MEWRGRWAEARLSLYNDNGAQCERREHFRRQAVCPKIQQLHALGQDMAEAERPPLCVEVPSPECHPLGCVL